MGSPLPYNYKLNLHQDYHRALPPAPGQDIIATEYKTEDSFPVGGASQASDLSPATNM